MAPDHRNAGQGKGHNAPEPPAPAKGIGDVAARRHAQHLCHAETEEHHRQHPRALLGREKCCGSGGGHRREQPRPRSGHDAGHIQHQHRRRQRRHQRGKAEQRQPQRHHPPSPDAARYGDQHRRQHRIGQRVDGQKLSGVGGRDVQVGTQRLQHTDDDERPHADQKVRQGQDGDQHFRGRLHEFACDPQA